MTHVRGVQGVSAMASDLIVTPAEYRGDVRLRALPDRLRAVESLRGDGRHLGAGDRDRSCLEADSRHGAVAARGRGGRGERDVVDCHYRGVSTSSMSLRASESDGQEWLRSEPNGN